MVHSHLHLVSWLLINFVRIVSKSNANGFPLKISMNAHEKKPNCQNPWNDLNNAFGHRLEIPFWYCFACQCGFIFQRISNLFRMSMVAVKLISSNWLQIILSYSIELANKLKQIGYLSFRQNFPQMKIRTRSIYSDVWSTVNAIRCKNVSIVQCGSFGFRTTSGYSSNIIKYSHWNYSAPNVLNFIK